MKKRVKFPNIFPIVGFAELGKNYVRMSDANKLRAFGPDKDENNHDPR